MNTLDPYGQEYGDWEDPRDHDYCTGCTMCRPWEGRLYEELLAERRALVIQRRASEGGPATPAEARRQDNDYWTEAYTAQE